MRRSRTLRTVGGMQKLVLNTFPTNARRKPLEGSRR
jgi:hypothetical protein